MITVYHLNHDLERDERLAVTFPIGDDLPQSEAAAALFKNGGYVEAARVDGDMNYAYVATQNGVLSDSWSRVPPKGVTPLGVGYHLINGECYGYKSSEVGDIFRNDETGEFFVVARGSGFTRIDGLRVSEGA